MDFLKYLNIPKELLTKLGLGNKTSHVCQGGMYIVVLLGGAVALGIVDVATINAFITAILQLMTLK